MDIQRKAFESSNNVNPDWSFKFDEELQQYVATDFEMTNQVDEFNEHWDTFRAGWQAAEAQAVPSWISVKNAMPKASSQVLTYDDYGFVSVENIDGCEDPNNVYFSHWLPLPPVEQEPAND